MQNKEWKDCSREGKKFAGAEKCMVRNTENSVYEVFMVSGTPRGMGEAKVMVVTVNIDQIKIDKERRLEILERFGMGETVNLPDNIIMDTELWAIGLACTKKNIYENYKVTEKELEVLMAELGITERPSKIA